MAIRNRTSEFRQFREGLALHDKGPKKNSFGVELTEFPSSSSSESGSGYGRLNNEDDAFVSADKIDLAPGWMSTVDEINYEMKRIEKAMVELELLHKKHLLPSSHDDDQQLTQSINIMTSSITQMFQKAKGKIKFIGSEPGAVKKQEEQQIKSNLQSSLATQLQSLSVKFKTSQRDYMSTIKGRQQKGTRLFRFDDDELAGVDQGFSPRQQDQVTTHREMISERDREIRAIAQSINEIVEIFQDLATMVHEQGTILDRIDKNIEDTAIQARQGVIELQDAAKEQKKYRSKLCIFILCILVAVMVVVVIIKAAL